MKRGWVGKMREDLVSEELIKIARLIDSAPASSDAMLKKFDSLKKGQKIDVKLHEGWRTFIVGRKSFSKKYGVTTFRIIPEDRQDFKYTKNNAYTLRRRGDFVSGAHGNMGMSVKEIK